MDFKEPGMNYPGMWRFPKDPEQCCIYRVPESIRRVNPEAYTPQLVIIGPLHHSLRLQALESRGDISDAKLMGYSNVEAHKKIYVAEFEKRDEGKEAIDGFRRMIEEDEDKIRESYSESTTWIKSPDFVDMILHDSVFILEFILRNFFNKDEEIRKTGDPLLDESCLNQTASGDLILLENQIPYFILEKLFDPIISKLHENQTFRNFVIHFFEFEKKNITNDSAFKHFTDLVRCVHVKSLPELALSELEYIDHMYNASELERVGVKFEKVKEDFSLDVTFENGCLKMPILKVVDNLEMTLRNVMAFEQCHDLSNAHVCAYIIFLDYLIDTEKDVELLVKKGIIQNNIGKHELVAEMVNRLCLGIVGFASYYPNVVLEIRKYYRNPVNRSLAVLNRVYFSNLWMGTGTVAAMFLLLMTLIQTVSSILQLKQKP